MAVAHYMRYHKSYEEECESVAAAFMFLAAGEDACDLSSFKVVDGDNEFKRGELEFDRMLHAAWDKLT